MRSKVILTEFIEGQRKRTEYEDTFGVDEKEQELYVINLYPHITFQTIDGFGGAITEAVGATLKKMPETKQQEIIQKYFSKDGIGYNIIRTHLDSCDFSLSNYSAVTDPNDKDFKTFSLKRDEQNIIPFIKMAYDASNSTLPIMLSPWSPPAFMKTNNERNGGGKLKGNYYLKWASYICHYITAYLKRGINVSSISVQNEPNACQTWDSCLYTAHEEKMFIKDYLYPELQRRGLKDIKIYIWDHNKERMFERAEILIDNETNDMIEGIAFHWYTGDHFDSLALVNMKFPEKKLVLSEACIEYSRYHENSELENAQFYAHDIIGNLKNGMNKFIDWNILLNEEGGPNHVGNYCEAPIMCDIRTGSYSQKLSFYYIEHFSRYIEPGAVRIATTQFTDKIELVAFKNPNEVIVVIILNRTPVLHNVNLRLHGSLLNLEVPGKSIITVLI